MNLTAYSSSQVKIRFRLRTDSGVTRDGWYLDDIGVFYYTIPTDVSNITEPLYDFSLEQNYPNPFNPSTKIKYSIPSVALSGVEGSLVTLKVFDVLGNEVTTLVNEEKPSGEYEVVFDAAGLSSGIYFYKLQVGSFTETKKLVLIR
ncbi:MAG: T9SS type A sorting domain-containing protein [Ignavibacteriaceae bacterium]|nr:T9SS type A sorting domain-containing protein [Ignavibacteriaceae bacterium]